MSSNDINIGALSEALNNKADLNLLNLSDAGKVRVANLAAPSSKYLNLTLGATDDPYTAPAEGYVSLVANMNAGANYGCTLVNSTSGELAIRTNTTNSYFSAFLPVQKGDEFKVVFTGLTSVIRFRFIYSEGAK